MKTTRLLFMFIIKKRKIIYYKYEKICKKKLKNLKLCQLVVKICFSSKKEKEITKINLKL